MRMSTGSASLHRTAGASLLLGVSLLALGASAGFAEGPQGGTVVRGAARITAGQSQTTISQSSQRAVIDWKGFDVGQDHTVTFRQPGRSAATLNRIGSAKASVIQGQIKAPGTVILQNNAGIVFSGNARVEAGGLVATSQTVNAARFQKDGALRIGGGEHAGAQVVNRGGITLGDKGLAALVGTSVENSGAIVARSGTVALASGKRTAIDLSGDGSFQIRVDGDSAGGGVVQSGLIDAGAGSVLITAGDAARALDSVINTSGLIRATSAGGKGGQIRLEGRGTGKVTVAGGLEASGATGGGVTVTGAAVALTAEARLRADGTTGGGSLKVGGERQGKGSLRRADTVAVESGAGLSAAGGTGRGGDVVVWSDDTTRMDGRITATGAAGGGTVETSGKGALALGDTAAVETGAGGAWLLDPRNVTIAATGASVGGGTTTPPAGDGTWLVSASALTSALQAGTDVTIATTAPGSGAGNIVVESALSWSKAGTLTLDADGNVSIARAVTVTDGSFIVTADGLVTIDAALTSRGAGNFSLTAGTLLNANADIRASGTGSIALRAKTGNLTAMARSAADVRITTTTGAIDLTADAGDVILHRVAGTDQKGTTVEVNSKSGPITMTAADRVSIQGGQGGQWVRVGSNNSSSDIVLRGARVKVRGGTTETAFAEVVTGAGGAITVDATDELLVTGGTAGRIAALNGADLSMSGEAQTWNGEIRAGSGGHTGGNVFLSGAITAGVEPVFGLAEGARFTLTRLTPHGHPSSYASPVPLAVSTKGTGTVEIGGAVSAAQVSLISEERVGLGVGASLTATGASETGAPLVVAAGRQFRNDAGANVLKTTASGSRWLVYIDKFAGMTRTEPGDRGFDLYGRSPTDTPPGVVSHTGNRIIYAERPVLTITGESLRKTYGETVTPGVSVAGLRTGDSLTTALASGPSVGSDGSVASAGAGSYATEVAATASSQGYLLQLVDGTLDVDRAALTITATGKTRTYGQANPGLDGTVSGFVLGETLADLYGSLGFTTGATRTSDAGSYAITPGGVSSDNYAITFVPGVLTVEKARLNVSVKDADRVYGDKNPDFTADYSGFVLGQGKDVLTGGLTTTATQGSDAGKYDITTGGLTSKNYEIVGTPGTLTVKKAQLTVDVDDKHRTYGSDNPALTATYTGFKLGQDAGVLGGAITTAATKASDAGSYVITAAGLTSKNYEITATPGTLTVDKAALTVTVDDKARSYGSDNPVLTASYSGFVLGQGAEVVGGTLSTTATKTSDVGSYAITATGLTAKNYTITAVKDGTLTVNKAALTVKVDDKARTYGSDNPALTASYSGFVLGQGMEVVSGTLATGATKTSDAGKYVITASGLSAKNYEIKATDGTLAVKKAALTVTIDDKARIYGGDNPALTASYSGFVLGQDASIVSGSLSTGATKTSDVGRYGINASGLSAKNYDIKATDGTLTVKKAALSVVVDDKARIYGNDNPALTATYSGFVLGQDASVVSGKLATAATKASDVGTYEIDADDLSAKNYTITATAGTLTVNKAPLTVIVDDKTRSYGSANPVLTATYSGFKLGQDATVLGGELTTRATRSSDVGTYGISATGLTARNYEITATGGKLSVTPAALTITADDATRPAGSGNPVFTATGTGFVLGQDIGDLDGTLSLKTDAGTDSPVGGYAITPGGVSSGNYAIRFVDGTLTVGPGGGTPEVPVIDGDDGGAWAAERFRRGMPPLTPGDASFRTTIAEAPPAIASPFDLTYSLGEIVQAAPAGIAPATEGFVPAAGRRGTGLERADGDGAGRGGARGCDGPINLGLSDLDCTRQAVTESYWTTLSDGAR